VTSLSSFTHVRRSKFTDALSYFDPILLHSNVIPVNILPPKDAFQSADLMLIPTLFDELCQVLKRIGPAHDDGEDDEEDGDHGELEFGGGRGGDARRKRRKRGRAEQLGIVSLYNGSEEDEEEEEEDDDDESESGSESEGEIDDPRRQSHLDTLPYAYQLEAFLVDFYQKWSDPDPSSIPLKLFEKVSNRSMCIIKSIDEHDVRYGAVHPFIARVAIKVLICQSCRDAKFGTGDAFISGMKISFWWELVGSLLAQGEPNEALVKEELSIAICDLINFLMERWKLEKMRSGSSTASSELFRWMREVIKQVANEEKCINGADSGTMERSTHDAESLHSSTWEGVLTHFVDGYERWPWGLMWMVLSLWEFVHQDDLIGLLRSGFLNTDTWDWKRIVARVLRSSGELDDALNFPKRVLLITQAIFYIALGNSLSSRESPFDFTSSAFDNFFQLLQNSDIAHKHYPQIRDTCKGFFS
jgi:hypothetical protein